MLRDFKFSRRNPAKNANAEEVENVPPSSRDSLNPQNSTEPSRAPFNAITELPRIPKNIPDQEICRPNKVDRTPTKPKPKYSDASMHLRTPEKQGLMSRNRFNWAQKSDNPSNNGVVELKEEGRAASNVNTPSSIRAAGRATLSFSECNSVQSTPSKSVSKPPNLGYTLPSGSRAVCNVSARMAKGIPSSCNTPTAVNTVEVPYFELKEDPSFWLEHNVQVSCFSVFWVIEESTPLLFSLISCYYCYLIFEFQTFRS